MTLVFMFPGQSSRDAEMFARARRLAPSVARRVFEEASDALHRDLAAHYASADAFRDNRDVQIGVMIANHIHLEAVRARAVEAPISLGLSLGEYSHLVHAGAIDFADALRLVDARGRAYDGGPRGAMLAAFPVALEELDHVLARARTRGVLEVVNLNSPTQQVLAGERDAIDAAARMLDEELFLSAVRIEDRVPMHSSLFRPAADAFRPALDAAPLRAPRRPYLPNVLAELLAAPAASTIRELLYRHVFSPVRWRESVELVARTYPDATFVEVGPRDVLYGLMSRRWLDNRRFKTDAPDERALDLTLEEILHAA